MNRGKGQSLALPPYSPQQEHTMGINQLFEILIADLQADGVVSPLGEYFTLATIWHDLACIANEAVPADVSELIDSPPPVRLLRAIPKPIKRLYPCASCGSPVDDDGGVCDECAGFEEPYRCEACGQPAEYDSETCTAVCECCMEEDRERARLVSRLQA
ncbi:hypothetical protein BH11ARM1_BH11ARM1_12730 [soil metagenome]